MNMGIWVIVFIEEIIRMWVCIIRIPVLILKLLS